MIFLDSYKYESDFDNKFVLSNVVANAGDVIVIGVSGIRNAICFDFATPTWNGETFEIVSEVILEHPLSVFILKCASSGTYTITSTADNYGGVAATATVFSGSFGSSFFDAAVLASWTTGTYNLPSATVTGVGASDVVCVFLGVSEQNISGDAFPTTIFTSNGDEQIVATTTVKSGRMYACTNTGTGSVVASFTKSDSGQPSWRMAAFRLYESGGGGVTIDEEPVDIRVTEGRTFTITGLGTVLTTGNVDAYVNADTNAAITPNSVTNTTGDTYEVVITVPDAYAGLKYDLTGYPVIISTPDGDATSGNIPYLPVTGNDFVNITVGPGDFTVSLGALASGNQIEWETLGGDVDVDDECIITYTGADPDGLTFDVRAWDDTDDTWGAFATQALTTGGGGGGSGTITDIATYGVATYGLGV